ncbi:MAG: hypothetical protein AAF700_05170 [Pseudomonadota bacterium]
MVKQEPELRDTIDYVLSLKPDVGVTHVADLIKSRELSAAMVILNKMLLDGTPSEKEKARRAVARLGFIPD